MRLDHLLSREYNKSDQIDHGFGQRRKQIRSLSRLHCIVLRVLETVLSKGQKDEGRDHRGGVAQLGEHLLCKQGVIGSNPFISTNFYVGQRKRSSRAEVSSGETAGVRSEHGLIAQLVRAHA